MGENYFHGRVFSVKKYASAVTDDRTRVEVFIIISKQVYSMLFFTSCPIKTLLVDDLGIVSTFQRFQPSLDKGITHIFPKAQVAANKNAHNFRHHFQE